MAPAQIPVFLSQKPSTQNKINRRICNFILSVVSVVAVCSWGRRTVKTACFQRADLVRDSAAPSPTGDTAVSASGAEACSAQASKLGGRHKLM